MLRGRLIPTFYEYDDAGRMVRSWTGAEWTAEDRALMLGYQLYESRIHHRCGQEKAKAFHPDNDGEYEVHDDDVLVCWACTAMDNYGRDPNAKPNRYELLVVRDLRDYEANPLPPLVVPGVSDEAMGGAV